MRHPLTAFIAILLVLAVLSVARKPLVAQPPQNAQRPERESATGANMPADDIDKDSGSNEKDSAEGESNVTLRWNLATKTAGGTQFWTDHVWREGYRIQQNSLTNHWRLVDAGDVRRAWGTRSQCEEALRLAKPPQVNRDPSPGQETKSGDKHVIVLLHGLMRTHHSMKPLEEALHAKNHDLVIRFSYASTRRSISDHAAALREVIEQLPDDTRFSFVGHSMGNIVVRHLIGDLQRSGDPHQILERCDSMVMLGPPNQGALIARRLAPTGVFEFVTGKGGMELGPQWEKLKEKLATPTFPFAIIAGDVSENKVQNPLVDGSSDFVVTVEESKLEGAAMFQAVPVLHSFLMNDETVIEMTIDFLDHHVKSL